MKNIIDQLTYEDRLRKKKKKSILERSKDFDKAVEKFNKKFNSE